MREGKGAKSKPWLSSGLASCPAARSLALASCPAARSLALAPAQPPAVSRSLLPYRSPAALPRLRADRERCLGGTRRRRGPPAPSQTRRWS